MTQRRDQAKGKGEAWPILVAHGVNLDLLGRREPDVYGRQSLVDLNAHVAARADILGMALGWPALRLHFFQSNDEGAFLAEIAKDWRGAVINPGAWTHTSLALADRLAGLALPFVEVHLSNIAAREAFRHHSYGAAYAAGVVYGLGPESYVAGLLGLMAKLLAGKR